MLSLNPIKMGFKVTFDPHEQTESIVIEFVSLQAHLSGQRVGTGN